MTRGGDSNFPMKRRSEKEEELSSALVDEEDMSEHGTDDAAGSEDEDQGEQIDFTDEDEDAEEEYEAKPKVHLFPLIFALTHTLFVV
jgi:hypothetical protein